MKLNVPEEKAQEFGKELSQLMSKYGVTAEFNPVAGEMVYLEDSDGNTVIGVYNEHTGIEVDLLAAYVKGENGERALDLTDDEEDSTFAACKLRAATEEEIEEFARAFAKRGLRWNIKNQEFEGCPKYEAIRTYEDAVMATGITNPVNIELLPVDVQAYIKLRTIVAAINGLTETTLGDFPRFTVDEWRYYPWFRLLTEKEKAQLDEEQKRRVVGRAYNYAYASGGCVYVNVYNGSAYSYTSFGARVAFKTKEAARYCAIQFKELWADLYFLPRIAESKSEGEK